MSHFISLLDICLGRDCFNNHHKQLLYSWKQKLNSIWMTSGYERRVGGSRNRSRMRPLQRSSSGGAYMDFPISHWSSPGESRDYSSSGKHNAEEEAGLSQRKRLSLQNVSKEDRWWKTYYYDSIFRLTPCHQRVLLTDILYQSSNQKITLEEVRP